MLRTIDFRRQVLFVQDIFNALKEYKNQRIAKRELNQTQISVFKLQKKRRLFHRFQLSVLLRKKKFAAMFASGMHYQKNLLSHSFKRLHSYLRLKQALKRSQRRVQMKHSMNLKTIYFKKLVEKFEVAVMERRKNETLILYEDLEALNKSP